MPAFSKFLALCALAHTASAFQVADEFFNSPIFDADKTEKIEQTEEIKGAAKPHIVYVLIDDWGWANLDMDGHNDVVDHVESRTPTFKQLAKSGILLDRFYAYKYCSPSRASLQSGRNALHVSWQKNEPTTYNPDDQVSGFDGIPRKMTGVAKKLKEAGYRTHMTGKWDAGMATPDHTPEGRGYETSLCYFHHANDYYTQRLTYTSSGGDICDKYGFVDLWYNGGPADKLNGTMYEEAMFTANTLSVLDKHDPKEPLFMFHAMHVIHTPLSVPEDYSDQFSMFKNRDRKHYAAMVKFADDQIGKIVTKLKTKGMWENTFLVVTSDNGGPTYGMKGFPDSFAGATNAPLKGGKFSDWEGGIRVNAFVSGGHIPVHMRGKVIHDYLQICDWYTTFCALAGVDHTDKQAADAGLPPVDGKNIWPLITGEVETAAGSKSQFRTEIHVSDHALIMGDYKLLTGGAIALLPVTVKLAHPLEDYVNYDAYNPGWGYRAGIQLRSQYKYCAKGCLYNIQDDPYEKKQIEDQPELLAKMMARLAELNKDLFMPNRGEPNELACDVGKKAGGFYVPFVDVE